jgi:hypothetical protein
MAVLAWGEGQVVLLDPEGHPEPDVLATFS